MGQGGARKQGTGENSVQGSFTGYYSGDQIRGDEMGGACVTFFRKIETYGVLVEGRQT